jgi:hypothetical protein
VVVGCQLSVVGLIESHIRLLTRPCTKQLVGFGEPESKYLAKLTFYKQRIGYVSQKPKR